MKKFIFLILASIVFSLSVKAYYLSPSSGTMTKGGSTTISVYAWPATSTDTVAVVRMKTTNATITGFTPGPIFSDPTGTSAGACPPSNSMYSATDNTICVDLGKTTPINRGDLLGTFSVTWANINGVATVDKIAGSLYRGDSGDTDNIGRAGTYTLGDLPRTPFAPNIMPEIYLAAGGLAMIFLGIYLFQNLKDEKKNFNEDVSF